MIHYSLSRSKRYMNRNRITFIVSAFIIILAIYLRSIVVGQSDSGNSSTTPLSPTPINPQSESILSLDIDIEGKHTKALWIKVENLDDLFLYPNFSDSLTSELAKENNLCSELINGGFYTQENTPIGLFVSEGRQIASFSKNQLLNGVFSINYDGVPKITNDLPLENLRLGLQTGPVLLENGQKKDLSKTKEESARRAVVAINDKKEVYFLILYKEGSVFMGPTISKLPEIILEFSDKLGLNLQDAANLDGGSASAFHSQGFKLNELTPLGSYFCIK